MSICFLNPLSETLSTTSRVFCEIHKAPAHFRGATNIIPELHPRHYKTSTVTSELAVKTIRQSPDTFDSKWVPAPVGGAPSRHTGTGGAADGVHAQCLRDSARCWGQESSGAPKQAARRSRVVPRSKQLGRQPDEEMSSRASG
jgi:hypothetical protein